MDQDHGTVLLGVVECTSVASSSYRRDDKVTPAHQIMCVQANFKFQFSTTKQEYTEDCDAAAAFVRWGVQRVSAGLWMNAEYF